MDSWLIAVLAALLVIALLRMRLTYRRTRTAKGEDIERKLRELRKKREEE